MKKRTFTALAALFLLALTGCGADAPAGGPKIPTSQVLSLAAVQQAHGFTAGSSTAAKTAYVFFDAQCPHCGNLWRAAKPLQDQVKFVWIPVGFLNKASVAQGATILADASPASKMDEHEASLSARKGGISASGGGAESFRQAILKNSEILKSFGVGSIPYIVTIDAQGKAIGTEGAPDTLALAQRLGVPGLPVAK